MTQRDICAMRAVCRLLESATYSRHGKPEWLSDQARDAREEVRQYAVSYDVLPSTTVIEQAAKVMRAAIGMNEGE